MVNKNNGYGSIIIINTEMFASKAFRSLTKTSTQILLGFLGKRHFKNKKCTNCNYLTMTYAELMNKESIYSYTQPKITRAFDELLAKGFIEVVKPGGCRKKDKAVYRLVESWREWNPGDKIKERSKREKIGFQK